MSPRVWVESNGGPLLLLPKAALRKWRGIEAPASNRIVQATSRWNPDRPATDYDRACDIRSSIGTLSVGEVEGLVLGDEPLATSWMLLEGDIAFVRWQYAPSDHHVEQVLALVLPELPWEPGPNWTVSSSPSVLFDAAEPGDDIAGENSVIPIPPDSYRIQAVEYAPDPQTALSLIRLRGSRLPNVN